MKMHDCNDKKTAKVYKIMFLGPFKSGSRVSVAMTPIDNLPPNVNNLRNKKQGGVHGGWWFRTEYIFTPSFHRDKN